MTTTYEALTEYIHLVRAIGDGFHPDTPGSDYASLPAGYTAADVDAIIDRAEVHFDLHILALAIFNGEQIDESNPA